MKQLKTITLLVCLSPLIAYGQASRYDGTVYTVNQSAPLPGAMLPVLALSGATVQVCSTWNTSGCTALAVTYQSSTVSVGNQCPSNAQLYNALANACSSTADVSGGWGIWAAAGSYAYFVTTAYGTYGPYPFGIDAAGAYVPSAGGTVGGTDYIPRGCINVKATLIDGSFHGGGAAGDGVTDDTNAIQTAVEYANTHPIFNSHSCIRLPAGKFLITDSINMCATEAGGKTAACVFPQGVDVIGEGSQTSVIYTQLPSSKPYAAIDFGGSTGSLWLRAGLHSLSGDYSSVGLLYSHGNQSGTIGNNGSVRYAWLDMQNAATGATPLLYCMTDVSTVDDSKLYSSVNAASSAYIVGDQVGSQIAASEYYTLATGTGLSKTCTGNNNITHASIGANNIFGGNGQAAIWDTNVSELDGGHQDYAVISSLSSVTNYVGGVLQIGSIETFEPNDLLIRGLRTECNGTYTGAAPDAVYLISNRMQGRLDGVFNSCSGGTSGAAQIGSAAGTNIQYLTMFSDGISDRIFDVGGALSTSSLTLGTSTVSVIAGTIASSLGGVTIQSNYGLSNSAILAAFTSYVNYDGPITINGWQTNFVGKGGPWASAYPTNLAAIDLAKSGAGNAILPAQVTASQLGAPYAGMLYTVTDATTASAQGQVCAGGGSTYALAVANGSNWICYGYPLGLPQIRTGSWSISASTSAAVTFGSAMTSTPQSCQVTPEGSTATVGQPYVSGRGSTGFTVNVPVSGSLSGTYTCTLQGVN